MDIEIRCARQDRTDQGKQRGAYVVQQHGRQQTQARQAQRQAAGLGAHAHRPKVATEIKRHINSRPQRHQRGHTQRGKAIAVSGADHSETHGIACANRHGQQHSRLHISRQQARPKQADDSAIKQVKTVAPLQRVLAQHIGANKQRHESAQRHASSAPGRVQGQRQ